jgi:DNA-binding transcriptional ArsR family regulator
MEILFLLGHPVRWRIVEVLAGGPHTAGEIAEAVYGDMRVKRTVVSHQLRRLLDAEIVRVRHDWSNRIYRLDPRLTGFLRRLADGLDAYREGGFYDDIVLRTDAIAGSDREEDAMNPIPPCWCIQKVTKLRRP